MSFSPNNNNNNNNNIYVCNKRWVLRTTRGPPRTRMLFSITPTNLIIILQRRRCGVYKKTKTISFKNDFDSLLTLLFILYINNFHPK